MSTRDLANRVGLSPFLLHCFLIPSKLMRTTWWGTRERFSKGASMYNTLNSAHHLMVETIFIHRRHCLGDHVFTPIMASALRDFLSVWVVAQTSFGGVLREQKRESGSVFF